jgi:hypothetical protein
MHDEPLSMTEEERFQEVAAILAAGILRLRGRILMTTDKECESSKNQLASPPQQSVTIHAG